MSHTFESSGSAVVAKAPRPGRERDSWALLELSGPPPLATPSSAADRTPAWREHGVKDAELLCRSTADVIAIVEPRDRAAFLAASPELLAEMRGATDWAIVLVPWREPPRQGRRHDGPVHSFVAAGSVVRRLLARRPPPGLADVSYLLLEAVLNRTVPVPRLCVRQLGRPSGLPALPPLRAAVSLIMAHRGDPAYLRTALEFIDRAASASRVTARIGLDVDEDDVYRPIARQFDRHDISVVDAPPTGPYVIRQRLVEQTTDGVLVFQDSDDASTYDRFVAQHHALVANGADLVGCHELTVDEIERRVDAFRFPSDVSGALAHEAPQEPGSGGEEPLLYGQEPLLHATMMVRRPAFVRAGGLSTDQRIANDTQFMLRASFSMTMKNSDEFLYIRRRHPRALTVEPRTASGCDLRRELARAWWADFQAVKRGAADLITSSLRARASATPHALRPLRPLR